jgi:hypothetical protein
MDQNYEFIYPEYWNGTTSFVTGSSTVFGYFDSDPIFVSDAPKTADFIARQLGWDVIDIEITEKQIYSNIELSMIKFSELINNMRLKDNYFALIGQNSASFNGNTVPYFSFNFILRLSDAMATEAGVGGSINFYTGSINLQAGKGKYNLRELFFQNAHPNESAFTIRKVMNWRTGRTVYNQFFTELGGVPSMFSPYDGISGYQVLLPISEEISRIQRAKVGREVFLAARSYELIGDNIRLFPTPKENQRLHFEYSLGTEETSGYSGLNLSGSNNFYQQSGLISSPTDVNYQLIPWSNINAQGKAWIIQYALALSKQVLGLNRRKFQSIPYPNGEVTLDGDALVGEGIAMAESLVAELKETLGELTIERGMEMRRTIEENKNFILGKMPLGFFKL